MTTIGVAPRGYRAPAPQDRRPMTPLKTRERRETFRRPVNYQDGQTRPEVWAATSACGTWRYERQDDGIGTLWTVTYWPTGQIREGYGTLNAGRRDTAATLLDELRSEAFVAALVDRKAEGHRWLAVHMRLAGADVAEYRCACGGLLVTGTRDGRLAHVDGCARCYRRGEGFVVDGCLHNAEHVFCGEPRPVECAHYLDRARVCGELAVPSGGEGCGRGQSAECCTRCCNGE